MKSIVTDINIRAIASCLPEQVIDFRKNYKTIFGDKRVEETIRATGVEQSHLARLDQTSSDLCFCAAEELFKKEKVDKSSIDGLVFVSQTADYILPSTSIVLQNKFGLSKDAICMDIHYGCSGYIYGLLQAVSWIKVGMCKNVLLLTGETNSKLVNPLDCALKMVFGDAGTATLLTRGDDEIAFAIHSDGSGYDQLIIPAGGYRLPVSGDTELPFTDKDGNIRTKNDMYMNGMGIFSFSISNVPSNIREVLLVQNWSKEDVGMFAFHQANRFIIDCIRKQLKLQWDVVPLNLQRVGNTGPASIPLLLSELGNSFSATKREKVIMSGFGVGLSWGAVACNLSETHFYEPINM